MRLDGILCPAPAPARQDLARPAPSSSGHRMNRVPKIMPMENHGDMSRGSTPVDIVDVTAMFVKGCRILTQTLTAGGAFFLPALVERIDQRPDELARRRGFAT